ncbi:MAG: hypothetical protein HOE48_02370 [Candidatus Latescibacteria bacterium]|jgi:hypothetical protein|nr:hypothetical protein [Candidatus Latescibacterota bacterium]MBT4136726.1 hypothetical protein [Candidatus Latescibacterota bacterium]MBT5832291.1 hypothetical protein [Candidatus Latescibacterota bacterium]
MLTEQQLADFEKLGVIRLPGAIAREDAEVMGEQMWNVLGQFGAQKEDRATWVEIKQSKFKKIIDAGAFNKIESATVCAALDELFGEGEWIKPDVWPSGILFNIPRDEQWDVPTGGWHIDSPVSLQTHPLHFLAYFTFLNTVKAGGGGTLIVTGSHHIVRDIITQPDARPKIRSNDMKKILIRTEPWMQDLFSDAAFENRIEKFMTESISENGHALRVMELTGEPGDVFLMHPWLLHTSMSNINDTPRMMLLNFMHGIPD